jgi:3-oxoacyl-[acyl-carrier protein] reductase
LKKPGVVLCASTLGEANGTIETELAAFAQVLHVNLLGNLAVLQACMPRLLQVRFGRVVFFAGGGAAYAYPLFSAYAISKVSTVRLVENLAVEYPPVTGLSFVALAPGAVATPMLTKVEAAGGEVRTRVDITEPVNFVREYLASESTSLSGRFFHVRDEWRRVLAGEKTLKEDQWLLRRVP